MWLITSPNGQTRTVKTARGMLAALSSRGVGTKAAKL